MSSAQGTPPVLPGLVYRDVLGSGGYSDVFLYERQLPKMQVAVKVLHDDGLTDESRRRFTDEANAMAALSQHPYIVQILGADVCGDGRPYLVMQYYPRPNLSVRSRREALAVPDVLRIGIQISSAVETAHRGGILHRDIKPANILTGQFGDPGLTDFGIAATTVESQAQGPEGMSIPWSPPEVFDSEQAADATSDVYSLAATLYSLLTGRSPFEVVGGNNGALELMSRIGRTELSPTGRQDTPQSLERLLRQAMAKNPAARPQSALAFARSLQEVEQELRLKVTSIVIPEEEQHERPADDEAGETRARMPIRVEAQGPQTSVPVSQVPTAPIDLVEGTVRRGDVGRQRIGMLPEPPVEQTVVRPSERASAPVEEAESTRAKGPIYAVVGVVALCVVGLLVLALSMGGGKPKKSGGTSPTPAVAQTTFDPLAGAAPPAPVGLSLVRQGTSVEITWQDADPQPDDFFQVRRTDPGASTAVVTVTSPKATLTGVAATDKPCVAVVLARKDGSSSPATMACVAS